MPSNCAGLATSGKDRRPLHFGDVADSAVVCGSTAASAADCDDRPRHGQPGEDRRPLRQVTLYKDLVEHGDPGAGVGRRAAPVAKQGRRAGPCAQSARRTPRNAPRSGFPTCTTRRLSRVGIRRPPGDRAGRRGDSAGCVDVIGWLATIPARPSTGLLRGASVHDRPATGALLAHEGGGDGAGEEGPRGKVPERGTELRGDSPDSHAGGMTDAGSGPEVGVVVCRRRLVRGHARRGPGAPVDEAGIDREQVLGIEAETTTTVGTGW